MTLEMMPIRLRRQPARTNPRSWIKALLGVAATLMGLVVVVTGASTRGRWP